MNTKTEDRFPEPADDKRVNVRVLIDGHCVEEPANIGVDEFTIRVELGAMLAQAGAKVEIEVDDREVYDYLTDGGETTSAMNGNFVYSLKAA